MKTPILKTDRLILRPFCIEDVKDVFEGWESDLMLQGICFGQAIMI